MTEWINIELQKPSATLHQVLTNFISYFTSDLQEWWITLAQYKQIQSLQLLDVDQFMHKIYMEFLGSSTYLEDQAREEFFKLKCC